MNETEYSELTAPDDLILPMGDNEYVAWLKLDRYGNSNLDTQAVLNFVNIISSSPGWEEKELIIYKLLLSEGEGY